VLYCAAYNGMDSFRHNTPAFSQLLLFSRLDLRFPAVGCFNNKRSRLVRFDYFDVYFATKRTGLSDLSAGTQEYLGDDHSVRLVVVRDFPAAWYGLRLAREFGCSACHDPVETWTGYFIRNGRRKMRLWESGRRIRAIG
jgi:hypothetical protein